MLFKLTFQTSKIFIFNPVVIISSVSSTCSASRCVNLSMVSSEGMLRLSERRLVLRHLDKLNKNVEKAATDTTYKLPDYTNKVHWKNASLIILKYMMNYVISFIV